MNLGRELYDYSLIPQTAISSFWLLGFVEGEGTFGFKNLYPYFQIAQHSKNLFLFKNIEEFLANIANGFNFTKNSPVPKCSRVLNTRTDVYSLSVSNTDSLYDYIIFFFFSLPFQTRKGIDFKYWAIALHLRKFGYVYTSRELILKISKSLNKDRYTTSAQAVSLLREESILEVLDIDLPIKLTPKMSNTQLSRAYKQSKLSLTGYKVWIYDNDILMSAEGYPNYASANAAIGLNRSSVAIGRNIDTGKKYKDRYTFYSYVLPVLP